MVILVGFSFESFRLVDADVTRLDRNSSDLIIG